MINRQIENISSDISNKIIETRREIHRNPELGFKEYNTSSLIAARLESLSLEVRRNVAQTGIIGLLKGNNPGKTFAIRADMDALAITELNDCEYISKNLGIMHACGHDAHISIVLGAAEILSQLKDKISGNIKFIFQPAEEGLYGAKYMVEDGALSSPEVDAIIATHVSPILNCGQISLRPGPVMATPSDFEITIIGKSGHAAEPQNAVDPITIGANLINLLQTIVSREKHPFRNAVLSVTYFNAGSSFNIIPDTAVLRGTVRTFDTNLDKSISKRMEEMTASLTKAMGAEYKFTYVVGYPPVINDDKVVKALIESSEKIIGRENIITDIDPVMLAEDFSYYIQKVPGAIFNLGCGNPEAGINYNLHNSRFNIDERCLEVGMKIMAQCAVDFLSK